MLQARWPEEELKHTAAALRHYDFAGTFPRNIGGAMKRNVLRDDEARAGSICLPYTQFFLFSTKKPLDIETLAKYTH